MNTKKGILITFGLYAVVAIAFFIVPRFAGRGLDGLSAMLAAMSWIMGLGGLGVIIALVALVMVIVGWKKLTQPIRMAGLAPMVITIIITIVITVLVINQPSVQTESPSMEDHKPQRKTESE